jgi:preprotein translocase subunit SecG
MNRVILLAISLFFLNLAVLANINQVEQQSPEGTEDKSSKQKMEDRPSSTVFGGARSGELEIEKQRDEEKERQNFEKQKRLYEYDGYYRKGL